MGLTQILVFTVISSVVGLLRRPHLRLYTLFTVSVLAVFALQPALPIRGLDFWLPVATLGLVVFSWYVTTPRADRSIRQTWPILLALIIIILILGATRYFDLQLPLPVSRPPQMAQILIIIGFLILIGMLLARLPGWIIGVMTALLILLLVILKNPQLSEWISLMLRNANQQSVETASALDIRWLGFSYISFRIIHTLRDRQSGRLPDVSLAEYVTYVIFFPALTAGPIHRIENFIGDLSKPAPLDRDRLLYGGRRLVVGLFKKFVVADCLALIALNSTNALQVHQAGWMWLILYAYAFQLLFDFSGYTDIAIGIAHLAGIKLPENFNYPYLRTSLTQFWNNWHMSLTQWFRAYFFNPLTRSLRKKNVSIPRIIFITQISTMLLIGLWHGVTWNFILWGLWHGVGLYINNRWTDRTKVWMDNHLTTRPRRIAAQVCGVLLTFNFVALGWVFFALPNPQTSWQVILTLFGVNLG
jgi:D-alanyl-lipoteichoic acid acyltransferase DltB (MBOAT superfamily)